MVIETGRLNMAAYRYIQEWYAVNDAMPEEIVCLSTKYMQPQTQADISTWVLSGSHPFLRRYKYSK
jgi:hypothetical protein